MIEKMSGGQYKIKEIAMAETIRHKKGLLDVHRTELVNKKKFKALCEDSLDMSRPSHVNEERDTKVHDSLLTR